uniref:Uncharacterized protein n=1 Tax=Tetradesmus obliquus TaxID=3088 RepID=A0A383VKY9_TETOB
MWNTGEGDKRVVKVLFAPDKGWFVLKRGQGTTRLGLPKSLNDHYDDYFDKYNGVQQLSVGHNGEWFVRLGSGWAWNGVHPTLNMLLKQDVSSSMTGAVQWVELGPDGTWVALFDKYTAWYGNHALTKALLSSK